METALRYLSYFNSTKVLDIFFISQRYRSKRAKFDNLAINTIDLFHM